MNLEFPLDLPAAEDRPYSVTEVLEGARQLLQQLPVVWVQGEVSGFKVWSQGQWYFTLKDQSAAMACVVWADDARRMSAQPEDGMTVFARGHLTVFPKRGQLQFTVRQLIPTPEGGFHALQLERARRALERDGLLEVSRKRDLPAFPSCVGVITSPEGAAWRDIVAVVGRRWPACTLVLIGARVQGEEAPRELKRALARAARFPALDVLIVGRGGGSQEDLHAFNDEQVARAVAASPVPTISAVGHETDVTLTDLVADVRAATPSAAAEKAVPDRRAVARQLDAAGRHLTQAAGRRVEVGGMRLRTAAARMGAAVRARVGDAAHRAAAAVRRMDVACERRIQRSRSSADRLGAALDALSPLRVLERGFAVPRDDAGRVLRRSADFVADAAFRLRVVDGEIRARVEGA